MKYILIAALAIASLHAYAEDKDQTFEERVKEITDKVDKMIIGKTLHDAEEALKDGGYRAFEVEHVEDMPGAPIPHQVVAYLSIYIGIGHQPSFGGKIARVLKLVYRVEAGHVTNRVPPVKRAPLP